MLKIDIISVQPTMFSGFLSESIVARAVKKGLCEVKVVDLKEYGLGRWKKTDDAPYGGGHGMLMRCEPWFAAVEACRSSAVRCEGQSAQDEAACRVIMTSPAGKTFTQRDAEMFASLATDDTNNSNPQAFKPSKPRTPPHLIFLCGHLLA